ncbi:MAG: hypothetical protein WBZ36_06070 [Candidatus Nitrosopolaris sp.]
MIEFPDLSLCLSVEIFHELDMVSEEFGVAVWGDIDGSDGGVGTGGNGVSCCRPLDRKVSSTWSAALARSKSWTRF